MCDNEKKAGCLKPDKPQGSSRECTPEHIRACHGGAVDHPCVDSEGCEHPERLKGKPGDCTPEQIRQCHGSDREHRCADKRAGI